MYGKLIVCALAACAALVAPAAQAQMHITGPVITPPFTKVLLCRAGQQHMSILHGTQDNFAGAPDPAPTPSAALQSVYTRLSLPANIYDQTASDYHFGDTLSFSLAPGATVVAARLSAALKPNSGNDNDSFNVMQKGSTADPLPSPGTAMPNYYGYHAPTAQQLVQLNFTTTGLSPAANYPNTPPPFDTLNALTTNRRVDVFLQDDTAIDYLLLEMCVAPPPFDLAVSKKREGYGGYVIEVSNPGRALPAGAKIEMTEIVPQGLTVSAISAPAPWSCTTPPLPVQGPDAFTCTFIVPAGGLAGGANLPQIVLQAQGRSECANCARVRLYVSDVRQEAEPGPDLRAQRTIGPVLVPRWTLVTEHNMANNVSCAR